MESTKNEGARRTVREEVADLCHEQWSNWMKHLFSKCQQGTNGGLIIPLEFVSRWTRQMNTPYKELSPEEQDSDRREADKFLATMGTPLKETKELLGSLKKEFEIEVSCALRGIGTKEDCETCKIHDRCSAFAKMENFLEKEPMTKERFLETVGKDPNALGMSDMMEFKADYNSPELMWERFISQLL